MLKRIPNRLKSESLASSKSVAFFFFSVWKSQDKEAYNLKKKSEATPVLFPERKKKLKKHLTKTACYACFFAMTSLMFAQPVYASTDVWTKAGEIMKDVYNQIVLISTVAAIVTASVALLMMNFSRSGRTVDESRAWLKRICITWAILNGLGFIMAYVTPFFSDGKWTG